MPLGSFTEEHFDKTFGINVKGVVFAVQKALPLLQDDSSIVLNASISGSIGRPAFSIYAATKAAVRFVCAHLVGPEESATFGSTLLALE